MASNKKNDPYCWQCAGKKPDKNCSKCIRSFHSECCKVNTKSPKEFTCELCANHSESNENPEYVPLIPALVHFMVNDENLKALKQLQFVRTNGKIINPIDFTQIKQKSEKYQSFGEFREDISWMQHNCRVIYPKNRTVLNAAEEINNFIEDEILTMENCTECYKNAYEHPETYATMPCSQFHPVVWAKTGAFNYWPAKAVASKGNKIVVVYFGEHTMDAVSRAKCFAFSQEPPDNKECHSDTYEDALQEATIYIEKIRCKGRTFDFAPAKTRFDVSILQKASPENVLMDISSDGESDEPAKKKTKNSEDETNDPGCNGNGSATDVKKTNNGGLPVNKPIIVGASKESNNDVRAAGKTSHTNSLDSLSNQNTLQNEVFSDDETEFYDDLRQMIGKQIESRIRGVMIEKVDQKKAFENIIEGLEKENTENRDKMNDFKATIERLEKENTKIRDKMNDSEATIATIKGLEKENSDLRDKLNDSEATIKRLEEENTEIRDKMNDSEATIKRLEEENTEIRDKMNDSEATIKGLEKENSDLRDKMNDFEATIKRLEKENTEIRDKVEKCKIALNFV